MDLYWMVTDGFVLDGQRWICIGWSQIDLYWMIDLNRMITDGFVLDGHKWICIGWSQMDLYWMDLYWMVTD
jgi:hypothetical protein